MTASSGAASDTSDFFVDDDEETLLYIVEGESFAGDLTSRLESLSIRFKDDHAHHKYGGKWNLWVDRAKSVGLGFSESLTDSSPSPGALSSLPSAFESEDGRKHLKAASSFLRVSESRATQMTMSALRSLNEPTHFQSLLGTRALLWRVMEYHFRQRSSRISAIAECLRQDQASESCFGKILDSLDATYTNGGNNRGLFRYLLSIACQNDANKQLANRDELLAAKELRNDTSTTLEESFHRPSDEVAWHDFAAKSIELKRSYLQQEQVLAMEALVALLYQRLHGVRRADFMVLLTAMQSTNFSLATPADDEVKKFSQLAGLVCAECMGLWRVEEGNSADLLQSHPLLEGLLPGNPGHATTAQSAQAEAEIEVLRNMVLQCSRELCKNGGSPQSIALLSFGLLYAVTYNSILASPSGSDGDGYWNTCFEKGREMVAIASDKLSALDFLSESLELLVCSRPSIKSNVEPVALPYDWIFPGEDNTDFMDMDSDDRIEIDAVSLTYACIGQEILIALIRAFGGSILSVHHQAACQNLAIVCDLASKIYRNSRTLCESFWLEWENAITAATANRIVEADVLLPPLAQVLNSTHLLVSNIAQKIKAMPVSKEQLLATLVPLTQLLATICYLPKNVETALSFLPPVLLQQALCASTNHGDDIVFAENRVRFLEALGTLIRVGDSNICRGLIRGVIEPAMLLNALAVSDTRGKELVLHIAADLLVDAPVRWVVSYARGLQRLTAENSFEGKLEIFPLAKTYGALAKRVGAVAFAEDEKTAASFLDSLWSAVVKLSPVVTAALSNVSKDQVPLNTVATIFSFFSMLMEGICPILALHSSAIVRSAAVGIRDAMLDMLATRSIGEGVLYYALLPISLSIGYKLESYAEERSILQFASTRQDSANSKYGPWYSAATRSSSYPAKDSQTQVQAREIVEKSDVDFDMLEEKSGLDSEDVTSVVAQAFRLIRLWVIHLDGSESSGLATDVLLDHEQRNRILSLSPQKHLTFAASMPQALRSRGNVKALWDSAGPTNFQLITRYLDINSDSIAWPLLFPATTLDVINACVSHVRIGCPQQSLADSPLCKSVWRSTFLVVLTTLSEKALAIDAGTGGGRERKELKTLGILSLRVLCNCSLESFLTNYDLPVENLIVAAFRKIRDTSEKLHKSKEAGGGQVAVDDALLDGLQIGSWCLAFLRVCWRCEGKLELAKYYDTESSSFASLAKLILQHATIDAASNHEKPSQSGYIFTFVANAIDFLCHATDFAFNSDSVADSELMSMWREDSFKLISMPTSFTSVEACMDVARSTKDFSVCASILSSKILDSSPPINLLNYCPAVIAGYKKPELFSIDVSAFAKHLALISEEPHSWEKHKVLAISLYASFHALHGQLALNQCWRKFNDVLIQVFSKNSQSPGVLSQNLLPAVVDTGSLFLSSALEALRAFRDNLLTMELSRADGAKFDYGLNRMPRTMTGLSLQLIAEGIERVNEASPDDLIDILWFISHCAVKVFNVLENDANECCLQQEHLLGGAIGVLHALEFTGVTLWGGAEATKVKGIVDQLVGIASQLLKLNRAGPAGDNSLDCVKTCVVLLSVLVGDSNASALAKTFEELEIVEALVAETSSYSRLALSEEIGSLRRNNSDPAGERYLNLLWTLFDLFLGLSQAKNMHETLFNSGAVEMLTRNPLFDQSRNLWSYSEQLRGETTSKSPLFPLRGYIPTRNFAGKEDPLHALWCKMLRCFVSLKRSSKKDPLLGASKKKQVDRLFADFIVSHNKMIKGSLQTVQSSAFTRLNLEEATMIIELLAEICARPCSNRRIYQLTTQEYLPIVTLLFAQISSFLGSSSASRELFTTVDDTDESEDEEVEVGARLSPFGKGRVHNPRHEAIRYSHYASRSCTAVTEEDFDMSSGSDDRRSASALEKNGKASITSGFAKAIERSAAECLFAAASLIWETYPSCQCFSFFERNEQLKIDAMPLVKAGMIIAYSSDRETRRPQRSGLYPSSYIHFAQVMHCNTLDRAWYVRDLEEPWQSEVVQADHIAGIEDTSKRRCILEFTPAPESASDLECAIRSPSVGHLLLALRWCACAPSISPMVKRLAGLLSALLGAELSMHNEIGSSLNKPIDEMILLDAQLLQILSSLKPVLDQSCVAAIRQQLNGQLERAEQAENSLSSKNEMMAVEDGLFLRSSGRSPFHDLRMNCD